ncbi:MAG: lipase secretion chaperone [Myxococcota bacterium]|nr:lipase secretion chaperone [Myxococcota bacterium]
MKRALLLLVAFAFAGALFIFFLDRGEGQLADGNQRVGDLASLESDWTRATPEADPVDPSSPALMGNQDTFPPSLRETDPDGGLWTDADGHFVPHSDSIAFFDYFFAATGEVSEEELHRLIVQEIRARLSGPAAAEAEQLLDQYVGMREDLRALSQSGSAPHDLERRWQWIRELRRKHFGAELSLVLFGESEEALAIDLARRRVMADETLESDPKARRLEALHEGLPDDIRQARERVRKPARVHAEVNRLREAGATDEELFRVREEAFGLAAAERLAKLDAERLKWQDRFQVYFEQRQALLIEMDEEVLTSDQRRARLDSLLETHFHGSERRRARALAGGAKEG